MTGAGVGAVSEFHWEITMCVRFLAAAVALVAGGSVQAQPVFNLYDLGDLGALQGLTSGYSVGQSVNRAGLVAGNSLTPDLYNVGFRTGSGGIGQGAASLLGVNT